ERSPTSLLQIAPFLVWRVVVMSGEVGATVEWEEPPLILDGGEVYRNPTEVKMSQIVLPCHANHCGELSIGQLLKWMDSTACLSGVCVSSPSGRDENGLSVRLTLSARRSHSWYLYQKRFSAERHAGCSCVTASVDDIHFEQTIGVGQVVSIRARVNRAFTSSMEVGIVVTCEDLYSSRQWSVCHAFSTFVARRPEAGKLKQVIPHTQAEQIEYSLAAERRRMRLIHAEIIKDLLTNCPSQPGEIRHHLLTNCPSQPGEIRLHLLTNCPSQPGEIRLHLLTNCPSQPGEIRLHLLTNCPSQPGEIRHHLLTNCHSQPGGGRGARFRCAALRQQRVALCVSVAADERLQCSEGVPAERTRVESVELVLPPHTNHQVSTFGGQIMAWMENVATISASRLCNAHPTLRSIDMFHFRGPSHMGDQLVLKAIVNNAFRKSMEVGVCAEAYQGGEPLRHINSAFMTFEVLDHNKEPCTLPRIRPEPMDGRRRFQEAIARKKIRLDRLCKRVYTRNNTFLTYMKLYRKYQRKYIISCKQSEVPLSVPWDPTNQMYLSFNNVSALKMLAARNTWVLTSEKKKVSLYTLEENHMLSFKVETHVAVGAEKVFVLLSDLKCRHKWDPHYKECEVISHVDGDDTIYRVVTPSVSKGGKVQDFILLASRRRPCDSGDPYWIALCSVSLPAYPPTADYNRGEVLCAGFSVEEEATHTKLSYYNQATPGVLPYISTDIAGLSSRIYSAFTSCRTFLEENEDSVTSATSGAPATLGGHVTGKPL
ncbi:hypothetical protein P4O66_022693, partial [Electrophorus voltai]